ncbi:MAG TPA: hypothetical protein VFE58_01445 [Tepidisphaeraceae bacterium]|jgi:hypothetical protein|nr:hypothetical protein [Tepidisphaeraceae bacterium]
MASNDNYDPEKEKAQHEDAVAAGTAAATGLGCIGFMLMPWTILVVIFALFIVIWMFIRGH